MDVNQLVDNADTFLEQNEFSKARELYKQALLANPSAAAYANLATAERSAAVLFIYELTKLYPESGDARHGLAHAYLRARRPEQALAECNKAIALGVDETRVRILRFKAAVAAGEPETAFDDFEFVWHMGYQNAAARKLRKSLVKELALSEGAKTAPLLVRILAAFSEEPKLQAFARAKLAVDQSLDALVSSWG